MKHSHEHTSALTVAQAAMPGGETLFELADLFKLFSDSTRVRILYALCKSELCVGAICEVVSMEQSAVSHQLKILREANLITSRRSGKTNIYSLADEHVHSILEAGLEHVTEEM